MKTAGVIAEFDPFHNGHSYFLRRVRELTSADFIIAVMSGDYTQRGNAAVMGKRLRAKAAMLNGADAVIELPVQYSTASAELFAYAGVSLLDKLGCVDHLCFGTETSDLKILCLAADILSSETDEYKEILNSYLKKGMNYPEARMKAAAETMQETGKMDAAFSADELSDVLRGSNNILAIEYLKALKKLGSGIQPLNIKRESVDHDSVNTFGIYSSAKNIRETLKTTNSFESVSGFLPENTLPMIREHFSVDFPVFNDDLSLLYKYSLEMETEPSLIRYADMSTDLARRIIKHRNEFQTVSQFTELIKTRNITYTRISRALLHTLLRITKEDIGKYRDAGTAGYARVIGFRKEASGLIDRMNEKSSVPVLTRLSDHRKYIKAPFDRMLEDTLRSSYIYDSVIKDIYDTDITPDISRMAVSEDDMILI